MFQKFTHPGMSIDPGPVTQADVDAFKGGIDPLAAAGKLGPLLIQFPPSFQRTPGSVDYLAWLLKAFAGYRSPSSCAIDRGATRPETARCSTSIAPPGCRSTSRSFRRRFARTLTGSGRSVLPAPAWTQRGAVVGSRRVRGSLQLFLFAAESWSRSREGARRRARWSRKRTCS
jgi:hypothetical protein